MPAESTLMERTEIDKGGRPCKYETHVEPRLEEIYNWIQSGYTDYSIADNLGISQISLIRYRDSYDNLANIYTRARKERNNLVMNSMFGKAVGIKETVKKAFKVKDVTYDEKGKKAHETERLEYGDEMIYVPPDVNAADLYLRNNDPEYKQAKQVESGQNITVNFQLPERMKELDDLDKQIKMLEMQLNQGVYELKDD